MRRGGEKCCRTNVWGAGVLAAEKYGYLLLQLMLKM
jgi:hypothetical protein